MLSCGKHQNSILDTIYILRHISDVYPLYGIKDYMVQLMTVLNKLEYESKSQIFSHHLQIEFILNFLSVA